MSIFYDDNHYTTGTSKWIDFLSSKHVSIRENFHLILRFQFLPKPLIHKILSSIITTATTKIQSKIIKCHDSHIKASKITQQFLIIKCKYQQDIYTNTYAHNFFPIVDVLILLLIKKFKDKIFNIKKLTG